MYLFYDFVVFVVVIDFEVFFKVDICIGIIIVVDVFFEVCKFVFKLKIDFGLGIGVC